MAERDRHDVDDELRNTKKEDESTDALEYHVNRTLTNLRARADKL